MSEGRPLVTHEVLPSFLKSPSDVDFTEETKEWLVAMLEGGLLKILTSLPEGSPFSSPTIEKVFISLLPEGSPISASAVSNAQALAQKFKSLGLEEPRFGELGIKLDQEAIKTSLNEVPSFKEEQVSELDNGEAQVFLAGLLEAIYQEFVHAAEEVAHPSPETGRKLIGENEIGAAWQAREGEWSALFVREGQEEAEEEEVLVKKEVDILLKIVMIQEHGTVSKLLKVTSAITVKELCQRIKKKMLTPTQLLENRDYYLFWHDEQNEETEGVFLDDEKTLEAYPAIRNDSTIELVPAERDFSIYVSETSQKVYRINEKSSLEKIIKTIVINLGFLEASRFGVVLLGDEGESGEHPPQIKLRESKSSYDVLAIKKDVPGTSPESPKLNRNSSLMKKNKRPSSTVFVKEPSGFVKNRTGERRDRGASDGSKPVLDGKSYLATIHSTPSPPSGSPLSAASSLSPGASSPLANGVLSSSAPSGGYFASSEGNSFLPPLAPPPPSYRMSLIDSQTIVQTKDRSEWLKKELSLKEQGIEIGDQLLLVRQEKIMSFYDRVEEDPIGLFVRLTDQAENIIKQLEAISLEVNSLKAGPNASSPNQKDLAKALRDHKGADDELQIKLGDEVEIIRRDGGRIYARLPSNGNEGFLPQNVLQEAPGEVKTLRQSPSMLETESPIRIQSYLLKKGRNFDHWKKRYCKLRNHCIWYYKSPSDEKPVGHFSVLNAVITRVPNYKKKDFVFTINSEGVERHLAAQSEEELEAWLLFLDQEKNR